VVTVVDALLLERSKGFFRGGFLATDYLEGPSQTVLFVLLSVVIDAAGFGLIVAVVAGLLRLLKLHPLARVLGGSLAAFGLLLGYDVISYQILRYLGDAFDLGLMLDLVDGNVSEILAVSSSQLVMPAVMAVSAFALIALAVWRTHRSAGPVPGPSAEPLTGAILMAAVGMVLLGTAATASDVFENGLLRKPVGRGFSLVVNALTDVDGDGAGLVGRSSDPDPFNGAVYPYAVDVPGNGVDEDGIGGDLPADGAVFQEPAYPVARFVQKPDVVLIVLESFRADLIGMRVGDRAVTPVLNSLAASGASPSAAYSHNGYTVQSRFHLFTGTLAGSPGSPTLIDDFKANGYEVAYISGQDESFGGPLYDVGFSRADVARDARDDRSLRYSTSSVPGSLAVPLSVVVGGVKAALARVPAERPLLLCVNFHDTHFPYTHAQIETVTSTLRLPRAQIAPEKREELWQTYVNTAANVDRAIWDVLTAVQQARGRQPGVVVVSDHGESLFDKGFLGHGYALNDVQTRVPLVVANLSVSLPDPFVQADLRAAVLAAVTREPGGDGPTVTPRAAGPIFQYLGDLSRPRQVAFLRPEGRLIYDFRSRRVQFNDDAWRRPDQLPTSEQGEFLELIRTFERIHLARQPMWRRAREASARADHGGQLRADTGY
jgi:hypothetical protein